MVIDRERRVGRVWSEVTIELSYHRPGIIKSRCLDSAGESGICYNMVTMSRRETLLSCRSLK